ncbi:hypothetical protein TRVL_06143 [Trypanosoma vivax]|nr:hypothetical protein TRVL_06143 [Trypanosoma vivax]
MNNEQTNNANSRSIGNVAAYCMDRARNTEKDAMAVLGKLEKPTTKSGDQEGFEAGKSTDGMNKGTISALCDATGASKAGLWQKERTNDLRLGNALVIPK